MTQPASFKLSICIATYNRANYLPATLDSIIEQATEELEIVISDNASTDNTADVVADYGKRFNRIVYFKQDTNKGFDRNFDRAVQIARGRYCWLMADDDLLKPGAVDTVMAALSQNPSVVIVNVEAKNCDLTKVLQRRWLDMRADRVYTPEQMDNLLVDAGVVLKYVGCVIIERALWLERERQPYYDSWFIWLGVIFQARLPANAMVIAEPLVTYRKGNGHTYSAEHNELWFAKMPALIKSFPTISESAGNKFWKAEPWKSLKHLMRSRALGFYSITEYRRWIHPRINSTREKLTPILVALIPGALVNAIYLLFYAITRRNSGVWQPEMELASLRESRFHFRNWRILRREP